MMKNGLIWTVVVVVLSGGTVAHAQSTSAPLARPVTTTATPLSDSAQRAAIALAKTPMASQPATPQSKGHQCAKGLVIGTGAGAAVGLGSAVALLMSSGGSDSAVEIMKAFTGFGATLGLIIGGAVGCK